MKRLEFVGFNTAVQEPPLPGASTGKPRTEMWDYGDQPGGDGNELFRVSLYEVEGGDVLVISKGTGVRHRVRAGNVAWSRDMGEAARADAARREMLAEQERERLAKEPEPTTPETPAAKKPAKGSIAPVVTKGGGRVTRVVGEDDEDAA